MKYGIREICDVVFRAKGACKVGNRIFYKDEPIMYFDTLKTSSLEAASSSVYAQGGRGNPRLIAWDGDRTLTFNMEDALISSEGLQILSGAGLLEASSKDPIRIHSTSRLAQNENDVVISEATSADEVYLLASTVGDRQFHESGVTYYARSGTAPNYSYTVVSQPSSSSFADYYVKIIGTGDDLIKIYLPEKPYYPTRTDGTCAINENYIYVFPLDEYGEVWTEPYIPYVDGLTPEQAFKPVDFNKTTEKWEPHVGDTEPDAYEFMLKPTDDLFSTDKSQAGHGPVFGDDITKIFDKDNATNVVLVDYYVERTDKTQQIEITADKFGGTYYIEAETLFRTQQGIDMPAEFIIPNGKIQSNFTFSMAATGDPSTFTFTVDAMPDYTRFDKTKKVLAAVQIIQDAVDSDAFRERTYTAYPDKDASRL